MRGRSARRILGRVGASEAAARLKHDLGKAIRFSAPEALEPDTEALRARLSADVARTRRGPDATRSAAEVFDAWLEEEGRQFRGPLARRVAEIGRTVEEIRRLSERLDALGRSELERLDSLTRSVSEACAALAVAASESRRGAGA